MAKKKSAKKVRSQKTTKKIAAPKATKKAAVKTSAKAAVKTSAKSSGRGRAAKDIFGYSTTAWISGAELTDARTMQSQKTGVLVFIGKNAPDQDLKKIGKTYLKPPQLETWIRANGENSSYARPQGPVWFFKKPALESSVQHYGLVERSSIARAKDAGGSIVKEATAQNLERLAIEFHGTSLEEEKAFLVGLEMGSYFYSENCANPRKPRRQLPDIVIRRDRTQLEDSDIAQAADVAIATNIARHLVNTPADRLNTKTYADMIVDVFGSLSGVTVDVWSDDKLEAERMGLLQAVGQGAEFGSRLVHIKYRPAAGDGQKPVAFVGKGVTFDTGGLDIKPSSAMRWMKKDMGGSASVVGLAYWAAVSKCAQPCDFYLALAENSVSARSFRPGDIITARNGLTIEIHNTDAEGRLVLADALDVAITQKEKPSAVINLATLTGAIKVGLGADIAGLFCNSDELSDRLMDCAQEHGDLTWRMPLYAPYKSMLRSNFADFLNASDGFAGAITAAIFLQQFVGTVPWAHWDIYAWKDGAGGACSEPGGNGQGVQPLIEFFTAHANMSVKTELEISNSVSIPYAEFDFSYATSSGAGGQNVNKVSTKAILRWWPSMSSSLSDEVRSRFMAKFRSRLTKEGELILSSQRFRSQPQNANDCLEKLREMIEAALVRPKVRRATKPTKGSKKRRLNDKRHHSETKQGRRKPSNSD